MDAQAARDLLRILPEGTWEDIQEAWKAARKPLLKELNRHDPGQEPAELTAQLEQVEAAYKVLRTEHEARSAAADEGTSTGSSRLSTRPVLDPGTLLLDRFEVRELISHRPEGDTYKARDRTRGTDVALKIVDHMLMRDATVKERIRQGAMAARHVHHAAVARVLDVQPWQQTLVLVQELGPGETLWDRVHGEGRDPQAIPRDVLLKWAQGAATALAALHRTMAHGTLRPESLWCADDGQVKVADAGFVGAQSALRERRLSRTKLGSAYWAPEQYREESLLAARSDQYSLALCFYEALSGKPAAGRTLKIRTFRRDYPRRFTRALERALSTKPARRFPDMDAFAEAAFRGFRSEHALPTPVRAAAVALPVLALLAVLAAFVFSPLGEQVADSVRDAVTRWRGAEADLGEQRTEWLRLRILGARLDGSREALDAQAAAELDRVRALLAEVTPPADERRRIAADLTGLLDQIVATSGREARTRAQQALAGLDALIEALAQREQAAREALAQAVLSFQEAPEEDRFARLQELARAQAYPARLNERSAQARAAVAGGEQALLGWRALWNAQAALAVGDESATSRHYGEAARALTLVAEQTQGELEAFTAFDPLAEAPSAVLPLDEKQRLLFLDLLVERAETLGLSPALVPVIQGLRAEAGARLKARVWVDALGAWALEGTIGAQSTRLGGTWSPGAGAMHLTVTVSEDRLMDPARPLALRRQEGIPTATDLLEALAKAPWSARPVWCARRSPAEALPAPELGAPETVVRGGEVRVQGRWSGPSEAAVLVDGVRVAPSNGGFETRIPVPGDVLSTHVRVHGAQGLVAGPAAMQQVRVDGLAPRVHLLEPAAGTPLAPGSTIIVRAVIYDSTLKSLTVGGAAQAVRPVDLYVVLEHTVVVPAKGRLVLPVAATDEAGNATTVEWAWPIQ